MASYNERWGYDRVERAGNMFVAADQHIVRILRPRVGRPHTIYIVRSQRIAGRTYVVDADDETCTCPDYTQRNLPCKHIFLVRMVRRARPGQRRVGVRARGKMSVTVHEVESAVKCKPAEGAWSFLLKQRFDIDRESVRKQVLKNETFRKVLKTIPHQIQLVAYAVDAEIPTEVHPDTIQVVMVEQGKALVVKDGVENFLGPNDWIMIPPGVVHTVRNAGNGTLKLLALYSPPEHPEE